MVAKLNVNIDHIATLRQQRLGKAPDLLQAVSIVEKAGADGITIHLREDRRHIQDADVVAIKKNALTKLNLEMAAAKSVIETAIKVRPHWATLVPEKRQELTTEGGLDVIKFFSKLEKLTEQFHKKNILVSFFVNPDLKKIEMANRIGGDFIEIHTGTFADARTEKEQSQEFEKIKVAAVYAASVGLGVNAGHGLNYGNIKRVAEIEEIDEFSIGFSIISRAVFVGLEKAVQEMIKLINSK